MGFRTIHQYPRLLMTKPQAQERRRRPGGGPGPELRAPGSRRRDQPWTCKTAFILQFHLQQYLQQFNLASILLFAAPELRLLTLAARPGYPGFTSRRWSWLRV